MNQLDHIHIVAFDVPFPANYGGVIDVFYKIKALHKCGIKVHLHCFQYGRKEATELNSICEHVYYYKRNTSKHLLLHSLPYIVVSRQSESLISRLQQDDYPILFEGLHSCYYLSDERIKRRMKIVRTHNIEHDYYNALANTEGSIFKKTFFKQEAKKLKQFEKILNQANHIIPISKADTDYFSTHYRNASLIPAFHPYDDITIKSGFGKYCLYHGNLSVNENNEAALYLVKEVFSTLNTPLIIAGWNPSKELKSIVEQNEHITLISNCASEQMTDLITDAHINVMPSFQATGMKLKLLISLFSGRHCIINDAMLTQTSLDKLCHITNTSVEMRSKIEELMALPFTIDAITSRKEVLQNDFSNSINAQMILEKLTFKS